MFFETDLFLRIGTCLAATRRSRHLYAPQTSSHPSSAVIIPVARGYGDITVKALHSASAVLSLRDFIERPTTRAPNHLSSLGLTHCHAYRKTAVSWLGVLHDKQS
jgi:hypothetical protein